MHTREEISQDEGKTTLNDEKEWCLELMQGWEWCLFPTGIPKSLIIHGVFINKSLVSEVA
jgi:hypothetical protein